MNAATIGTKAKAQENETPWTDDQIRWTQDEVGGQRRRGDENDSSEDDNDNDAPQDIFKPDPRTTFSFEFRGPPNTLLRIPRIELQGYTDESDQIYVSTGLTLWKSAEHLCEYMIAQQQHAESSFQGKRILELGAGLGLNGILAHHLLTASSETTTISNKDGREENVEQASKGSVLLTDGDTNALSQLRANVERNIAPDQRATIGVEQLLWGRDSTLEFLKRHQSSDDSDNDAVLFDVLLASDVVYVEEIIPPLWETIALLLRKPHGVVYFAYYSRRKVPVQIESVLNQATSTGFSFKCVDDTEGVLIYEFRWENNDNDEERGG